jgi:TRAP-type transport system small permease protein
MTAGSRTSRLYARILEACIALLIGEIVLVGFAAVVVRYCFSRWLSLYWADELIRYSFIWAVFLVSPLVIRRGAHLDLDLCVHRLPPQIRSWITIGNILVIFAFLLVLIVEGVASVRANLTQQSAALEIPLALVYLAVPVGGVLMLGEYLAILLRAWRDRTTAPRPSAAVSQ